MNSSFQAHSVFFFISLSFLLVCSNPCEAQNLDSAFTKESSYLTINSNFDSVYVIIDGESSSIKRVGKESVIEITSGSHLITIIPEYAPTYSFTNNFLLDSLYIANIKFKYILDEQNEIFQKIEYQDSTFLQQDLRKFTSLKRGSFGLITSNRQKYEENKSPAELDYNNTWVKVESNVDSLYILQDYIEVLPIC